MKKQTLKIVFAALLVVASVFSFASCATWDGMKEDVNGLFEEKLQQNDPNLVSVSLCSTDAVVIPETEELPAHVLKTITATVVPAAAVNKELTWEVYWITNNIGEEAVVTDYVTIDTEGEDNEICNVRCFQAFGDSVIGIKAKTVKGGCEAECKVTFVGEPTALVATINGEAINNGTMFNVGEKVDFAVTTENIFGTVEDGLCQIGELSAALTLKGAFTVNVVTENGSTEKTVNLADSDDVIAKVLASLLAKTELVWNAEENTGSLSFAAVKAGDVLVNTQYYQVLYVSGLENVGFHVEITDDTYNLSHWFAVGFYEEMEVNMDSSLEF